MSSPVDWGCGFLLDGSADFLPPFEWRCFHPEWWWYPFTPATPTLPLRVAVLRHPCFVVELISPLGSWCVPHLLSDGVGFYPFHIGVKLLSSSFVSYGVVKEVDICMTESQDVTERDQHVAKRERERETEATAAPNRCDVPTDLTRPPEGRRRHQNYLTHTTTIT